LVSNSSFGHISLNYLLNIKSVKLVNQKNPVPMNEIPSKFTTSTYNPENSLQLQNNEIEVQGSSLPLKIREESEESTHPFHPPSKYVSKKYPAFKITNPRLRKQIVLVTKA